ncbi:MAG: SAM-dependent methyltransferase [Robiginitomaculum sp.]|nr:MAG: SAM-dependent methyltransferase [Robiginitomaculum sp.]
MSETLSKRLAARIRAGGPISAGVYLNEALFDPCEGFYATKDPIGAGEDFITAPEVSQIFGELIGLWLAGCWQAMQRPSPVRLVEFGPGRGTMMKDILRAARAVPGFAKALDVNLIEASPALINVQAGMLGSAPCPVNWVHALKDVPSGPCLIVANEYLDCLPIRQFVRQNGAWFERMVDVDETGDFGFVISSAPASAPEIDMIPPDLRDSEDGALVEVRPAIALMMDELATRFTADPGAALFIDYGPAKSEPGDTLQAIAGHEKVDPLVAPGSADLTTRVDFAEIARAANTAGLSVAGPVSQGQWLKRLGLEYRAADLMRKNPNQKQKLARQVHRLMDEKQMGDLFKVMAVYAKDLPAPEGFDV